MNETPNKHQRMILTTRQLYVRYLREDDFPRYSVVHPVSQDDYARFVSAPSVECIAVCKKTDHNFIGRCGFRRSNGFIEPEIFLLPDERGKGYGRELLGEMISYAKVQYPGLILAGWVLPSNRPMVHLLEEQGFMDSGETKEMKSGLHHLYKRTSSTRLLQEMARPR